MLTPPNRNNKPKDAAAENAKKALSRDMAKRLEEGRKRWEQAAEKKRLSDEKTAQDRKKREVVMKRQMLEATERRAKAKAAEKRVLEGELARLEASGGPKGKTDELRAKIDELDHAARGLSSEVIREGQVIKKLQSGSGTSFSEDY